MATEHIYTVSSRDVMQFNENNNFCIAGSYRTVDRAVEECMKYVLERIDHNYDIMITIARDKKHPGSHKFFRSSKDKKGKWHLYFRDKAGLIKLIRNELENYRSYYVSDGIDSYYFDIDENDLVD